LVLEVLAQQVALPLHQMAAIRYLALLHPLVVEVVVLIQAWMQIVAVLVVVVLLNQEQEMVGLETLHQLLRLKVIMVETLLFQHQITALVVVVVQVRQEQLDNQP
jgi:hypothetical protein